MYIYNVVSHFLYLNTFPVYSLDIVPAKLEQLTRLQNEIQALKNENEKLRDRRDELEVQLESLITGNDTLQGGQVIISKIT